MMCIIHQRALALALMCAIGSGAVTQASAALSEPGSARFSLQEAMNSSATVCRFEAFFFADAAVVRS